MIVTVTLPQILAGGFVVFACGLVAGAARALVLPFLLCGPRPAAPPPKRGRKPKAPPLTSNPDLVHRQVSGTGPDNP